MPQTIAREAFPLAVPFGAAAAICFIFGWPIAGAVCAVAMLGVLCFFRDPKRTPPEDGRLVLAPADGRVVGVGEVDEPEYIGGRAQRVSIFMRLWDVHMTYAPVAGAVERVVHRPGRFGSAGFAKASERNEANSIVVQSPAGRLMFRQIAGMIARRIVCRVGPGDSVQRGERIGLIKFGSRVDVFLPPGCEVLVRRGQRVRGVASAIARMP
jgi:phosphatidylserine decarboxylase